MFRVGTYMKPSGDIQRPRPLTNCLRCFFVAHDNSTMAIHWVVLLSEVLLVDLTALDPFHATDFIQSFLSSLLLALQTFTSPAPRLERRRTVGFRKACLLFYIFCPRYASQRTGQLSGHHSNFGEESSYKVHHFGGKVVFIYYKSTLLAKSVLALMFFPILGCRKDIKCTRMHSQ